MANLVAIHTGRTQNSTFPHQRVPNNRNLTPQPLLALADGEWVGIKY